MTNPVTPAIESLIADARLSAHLATSVDDRPHVAPLWDVYADGMLSVLTGGRKLQNVTRNPLVALSIEHYDKEGIDWSVNLLGTATIVEDDDRVRMVQQQMDEKYDGPYETDGGEIEGDWGLIEVAIGSAVRYSY